MLKVGVLLSGCGFNDGSEVYEAVLTILALEKAGATVQAMAPDVEQAVVINHYSGEEDRREGRNMLVESARITRGQIISVHEVSSHNIDALIIVGGWGAVKNLCSYSVDGTDATVNPDAARLITEMHGMGKPIGAMCAGPILVALALKGQGISITTGQDEETARRMQALGVTHAPTNADEIHVDATHKIVTTAAFMLATGPAQAEPAITALVGRVLGFARDLQAQMPHGGAGNTIPGVTPHVH
jgi:enhancing lycopene biosynthesis protein 2